MTTIDWAELFPEASPEPPLEPAELAEQLALAAAPLTDEELTELRDRDAEAMAARPSVNPLQQYGFPAELLSLYRWCNGGDFTRGEREFSPLFTPAEIREYLVAYGVVLYLPTCIPFAMDGRACFYLFDLASSRVLFAGSNELDGPDLVRPLNDSLIECFEDERDPIEVTGL